MGALAKLTWVELKLFTREPLTLVFSMAFPLLMLYVLSEVFGNTPDAEVWRGMGPIDFYLPAYIGLAITSVGVIGIPAHLAGYREAGVLRRFRASSVSVWGLLGSQIAVAFVIAVVSSALLGVMTVLAFDVSAPESVAGVAGAFALSTLSFAALGFLLGALLPTSRSAQLAGLMLFFVMMLISGSGPPREVLGTALQRVADVMPLTHVVVLLQDPWHGLGWNLTEMGVVAGILVVSAVASVRLFRWE